MMPVTQSPSSDSINIDAPRPSSMIKKGQCISLGRLLAIAFLSGLLVLGVHHWHQHVTKEGYTSLTRSLGNQLDDQVLQRPLQAAARVASSDVIVASLRGDRQPDDPDTLQVLETLRASLDADIVYLLDALGNTIASTRFDDDQTLTGNNYAFRPYFFMAMLEGAGIYPALGVTTHIRGFYFSVRVPDETSPGVLVVKQGIRELDTVFAQCNCMGMLLSPDGIVFAANNPDWVFNTVFPLEPALIERLENTRQFGALRLADLPQLLHMEGGTAHLPHQSLQQVQHALTIQDPDTRPWVLMTLHDPMENYPFARMVLLWLAAFILLYTSTKLIGRNRQHVAMLKAQLENEQALARNAVLLSGITHLQREAMLDTDPQRIFDRMLQLMLETSSSEYGFIGEVLHDEHHQPFIKVRAISNIAWDEATMALYQKLATGNFNITNLNSLIGSAVVQREVIISNNPDNDPRRGHLPAGHPELKCYLGLPLTLGNELVGIVGIANRPGGYDQTMISILDPIVATSASLIVSYRLEKDRQASASALRQLSQAVEQSPANIIITDTAGRIEYVNTAFERNTGYSRMEVIGKKPSIQSSGTTPRETYQKMWATLNNGQIWSGEITNRHKNGQLSVYHVVISPVRDENGNVTHFLGIEQDISDRKRAEAEIQRLAYYDSLTGLPNRALLHDRTKQLLATASRQQQQHALLVLNIDRFKTLNDAKGQAVGDLLLCNFGQRLTSLLRTGDTLARLTADEFALLLPQLSNHAEHASRGVLHVAEKIQKELERPFNQEGDSITLTASMGITLFPESDNEDSLDILRRADNALHRAKQAGGNQIAFFETSMGDTAQQRFRTEHELRGAVADKQLRLHLQSQVDSSGQIVGAEALIRWQHPSRGLLAPGTFIPVAEESDLIVELGAWVLTEVCQILNRPEVRESGLRLSVNLSARQFRKAGFVPWIKNLIMETAIDPHRLTLEVTESLVIGDLAEVSAKMMALSDIGLRFSLDDFGTGYSSLAYLKRLPIDELKIDRMFVQDAPRDPNDAALVETILAVASHMHLEVVAEGVETPEQAEFIKRHPDTIIQGYLYGKPEPAEAWLSHWLSQNQSQR